MLGILSRPCTICKGEIDENACCIDYKRKFLEAIFIIMIFKMSLIYRPWRSHYPSAFSSEFVNWPRMTNRSRPVDDDYANASRWNYLLEAWLATYAVVELKNWEMVKLERGFLV